MVLVVGEMEVPHPYLAKVTRMTWEEGKEGKRSGEKSGRRDEWKRSKREWGNKREKEAEKGREQRWEKEGGAGVN